MSREEAIETMSALKRSLSITWQRYGFSRVDCAEYIEAVEMGIQALQTGIDTEDEDAEGGFMDCYSCKYFDDIITRCDNEGSENYLHHADVIFDCPDYEVNDDDDE